MNPSTLRGEIETSYDALSKPKPAMLPGPRAAAAPPGPLPTGLMTALVGALASSGPSSFAPPRPGNGALGRVLGAARAGFDEVYRDPLGLNDETANSLGIGLAGQNALNAYLRPADLVSRLPSAAGFALIDGIGQGMREAGSERAEQFVRDHKAMVEMVGDLGLRPFRR